MNIEITRITIVRSAFCADKAILHTELPGSTWPYDEPASLTLEVALGRGLSYCAENFPGVPVEVVWA